MPFNKYRHSNQGCRVGGFLGGVGVSFLTTLAVGVRVGFFVPALTLNAQLDHFLHHSPQLGILVEIVQFLLKILLKQRFQLCATISIDFNSQISFPLC